MAETKPFRPRGWRVLLAFLVAPFVAPFLPLLAMNLRAAQPLGDGDPPERLERRGILDAHRRLSDHACLRRTALLPAERPRRLRPIPPIIVGYVIVAAGLTLLQAMDHPVDREGLTVAARTATAGALGGLVFRAIAVWRDPRRRRAG